jgi:hypothetical protein
VTSGRTDGIRCLSRLFMSRVLVSAVVWRPAHRDQDGALLVRPVLSASAPREPQVLRQLADACRVARSQVAK